MWNDRQRPQNRRSSLSSPAAVRATLERVLNELLSKLSTCLSQLKLKLIFNKLLTQIIDVPDDVEELVQQQPVKQIVRVATETTIGATPTLDRAELDVTRQVPPRVKAKAAPRDVPQLECQFARSIRVECERFRHMKQDKQRFKRARERSAVRQRQALADGLPIELAASAGRDLHNPDPPSAGSSD